MYYYIRTYIPDVVVQLKVDEVPSLSTFNLSYSTVTFKSTIGATQVQNSINIHKHKATGTYQYSKQSTVNNTYVCMTVQHVYRLLDFPRSSGSITRHYIINVWSYETLVLLMYM